MNRRTTTVRIPSLFFVALLSLDLAKGAEETKPSAAPTPTPASTLSESARREKALQLLAKARTAALALKEGGSRQLRALRWLAESQAAAGDMRAFHETIQKATAIAEKLNAPSQDRNGAEALRDIVYTEVNAGDLVSARKTADSINDTPNQITGVENRNKALAYIGIAQAKSGDLAGALATAEAIHNSKVFIDNYTKGSVIVAVAVAQAKGGGDRAKSWKTIEIITDFETEMWAFADLAIALAKAGDFEGALATADKIDVAKPKGRSEQDRAFQGIAEAQAKANQFDAAAAITGKISDSRHKTEAIIEIVKAQAKKGDLTAARATAAQITDDYRKEEATTPIIVAQARAGDFTGAIAAAGKLRDSLKEQALSEIAVAQCAAGDLAGAEATADQIRDEAGVYAFCDIALAEYPKDVAAALKVMGKAARKAENSVWGRKKWNSRLYQHIAHTYASLGSCDSAESWANDIADWDKKAYTFRTIASRRANVDGFEKAAHWSEKLTDAYLRCVCFAALAEERLKPARQ